jgi:hypothetical protein
MEKPITNHEAEDTNNHTFQGAAIIGRSFILLEGYPYHDHEPLRKDVFKAYGDVASSLTDIDRADVAMLPNSWSQNDERQFAQNVLNTTR